MADVKSTVTELDEIRSRKSKKRADKNDQEKRADEAHAFTAQATFYRKSCLLYTSDAADEL